MARLRVVYDEIRLEVRATCESSGKELRRNQRQRLSLDTLFIDYYRDLGSRMQHVAHDL